ncbi:MAG: hypothetical protein DDT32_02345 [Syntrophomonadaceae bacterium]|nr:hypothetical protein [Bacillota bacterium]
MLLVDFPYQGKKLISPGYPLPDFVGAQDIEDIVSFKILQESDFFLVEGGCHHDAALVADMGSGGEEKPGQGELTEVMLLQVRGHGRR